VNDEQDMVRTDLPWTDAEGLHGPRVVAAVDGSAGSRAALQFAVADAARRGVPVEAVIAYNPPDYMVDFDVMGGAEVERIRTRMRTDAEQRVRAMVDELTASAEGPVPDIAVRAAHGSAADVLVRASDGASLLVVGSRGHGGFSSALLGSTSMQCALHATCPVTVVHSPEARHHRLRLHRERRATERVRAN
jgi:nucleotide-binding universal stress UspA family protein